jgi:hypothetical protein
MMLTSLLRMLVKNYLRNTVPNSLIKIQRYVRFKIKICTGVDGIERIKSLRKKMIK